MRGCGVYAAVDFSQFEKTNPGNGADGGAEHRDQNMARAGGCESGRRDVVARWAEIARRVE